MALWLVPRSLRVPHGFARYVLVIGLVSLVVRVAVLLLVGRHVIGIGDYFFYHEAGVRIGQGDGFRDPFLDSATLPYPTALHPPLWPGLLGLVSFFGGTSVLTHRLVGCVIGAIVVVLIGYLGRLVGGNRTGYVAAVLAACSPDLIGADGSLMSETLYGLFVVVALLIAVRYGRRLTPWASLALGVTLGLAALTRGEGLLFVLLLALPLAATTLGGRRLACIALVLVGVGVIVLPWTARNWMTFGKPVLISTNDSTVLAGANCPTTYARPNIGFWDLNCIQSRDLRLNEAQQADVWRAQGEQYASAHRARLVFLVAPIRVLRTWDLWEPRREVIFAEGQDRRVQGAGTVVFLVEGAVALGGIVLLRRRRLVLAILLSPVLVVSITSAMGFGMPRFRHAGELAVIVLAAVAIERFLPARGGRDPEPLAQAHDERAVEVSAGGG